MTVVLEARGDPLEPAAALDEDVLMRVDQDVADRRVAQQRLQWSEPEHIVEHLRKEHVALGKAQRRRLFGQQLQQQRANLRFSAGAIGLRERLEVETVQQLAMHLGAQVEILRAKGLWTCGNSGIHNGHQSEASRSKPSIVGRRAGAASVSVAPGRKVRVNRSNCVAMSLLPASVSGTPELSAIATVR